MTTGPTHGSTELFSDSYRLLGVLVLEMQSTDQSSDTALNAHLNMMLLDLGWRRSAMAFELLAGTALATADALGGLPGSLDDELYLDAGLADQPAVHAMLWDRVQANRWAPGAVTAELAAAYRNDPDGLAWVMFTTAARCFTDLCAHAAQHLGELDRLGAGDHEPQGITRQAIDRLTRSLQQIEIAVGLVDDPGGGTP